MVAIRRQGRFPGDPAEPDRTFGPLGGLVDDVFFWQKNRDRRRETNDDRLAALAAAATAMRVSARQANVLGRLRTRLAARLRSRRA